MGKGFVANESVSQRTWQGQPPLPPQGRAPVTSMTDTSVSFVFIYLTYFPDFRFSQAFFRRSAQQLLLPSSGAGSRTSLRSGRTAGLSFQMHRVWEPAKVRVAFFYSF